MDGCNVWVAEHGGAIFLTSWSARLSITRCTFSDWSVLDSGGVVYFRGLSLSLHGFAAVHCSSLGTLSGGNGPFVFVNRSRSCSVNESSGALGRSHVGNSFYLVASPGSLFVRNLNSSSNTAPFRGSGLCVDSSDSAAVWYCRFVNNSRQNVLLIYNSSSADVYGLSFVNNSCLSSRSDSFPGLLYIAFDFQVLCSQFIGNQADYLVASQAGRSGVFGRCYFDNRTWKAVRVGTVETVSCWYPGAIDVYTFCASRSAPPLHSSTSAPSPTPAMTYLCSLQTRAEEADFSVTDSFFDGCDFMSGFIGGAVYVGGRSSTLRVTDCEFRRCVGTSGGAVACFGTLALVADVIGKGCTAFGGSAAFLLLSVANMGRVEVNRTSGALGKSSLGRTFQLGGRDAALVVPSLNASYNVAEFCGSGIATFGVSTQRIWGCQFVNNSQVSVFVSEAYYDFYGLVFVENSCRGAFFGSPELVRSYGPFGMTCCVFVGNDCEWIVAGDPSMEQTVATFERCVFDVWPLRATAVQAVRPLQCIVTKGTEIGEAVCDWTWVRPRTEPSDDSGQMLKGVVVGLGLVAVVALVGVVTVVWALVKRGRGQVPDEAVAESELDEDVRAALSGTQKSEYT
jgi:hypothetical protein